MKRADATAALSWANDTRAAADTRITAVQFRILCVIAGGCDTRATIALAAGCGESTVPRAVRCLEKIGAISRIQTPGKPNSYAVIVRPDTRAASDTRINASRIARDTRISKRRVAGDTGAIADTGQAVDNICAHIEHAGARGTLTNLSTTLEFNPEPLESSGEGVARATEMPSGGGNFDPGWTLSGIDRAFANERGYLNGSCDELFGQFIDQCATKGPRLSAAWRSEWRKWVRRQVQFDLNRKPSHDQQSPRTRDADPGVRRRQRSPLTERAMRLIADSDAIDERRMDAYPGK